MADCYWQFSRMDPSLRNNADGDFLQTDAWSEGNTPILLPDSSEQYYLPSQLQNTLDLAFSDTTQTTPLSISGSDDRVKQHVLPFGDSTITYTPACSPGHELDLFQNQNPIAQVMTTTDDWSGGSPFPETDDGELLPAAHLDGRNMVVRMDGGVGHKRSTSPPQVVKANHFPDLASNWTWTHTRKSFNGEDLGVSWLSEGKRLLIEPHKHACGWPCPACKQRFKRQDSIKQHVQNKHPERFVGIYGTPRSTPEQTIAAPANCLSAHDDLLVSGLLQEERPHATTSWDTQLCIQMPHIVQSDVAFPGGNITSRKRSRDSTSPDGRAARDGSENESSSRLKTSHDNRERLFACPFYKHYPFQHRKCLALSLRRPKDVKQHIYRSHTKPEYYCASCYLVFHTDTERDTHCRERVCETSESPLLPRFHGITEDQRKLLKEKSPRELGVEDQWFQIYGIIFPSSEMPRSPYIGNCLEEIVPSLREKWETQGYKITSRAVSDLSHRQLSSAMDLFFNNLEAEMFEHETDDGSMCAASAQSHMGNNSELCT